MSYFIDHQLNIMMVLGGICFFIFIFLIFMKMDNKRKKSAFLQIAFFAMALLFSDRAAYIYRGDLSKIAYWMVRICNFGVYASILLVQNAFNNYLLSLYESENKDKLLVICKLLAVFGLVLLVVSQFTGLYYTFDEYNNYSRSDAFLLCYLIPIIMTVLQFIFIIKNSRYFKRTVFISLLLFVLSPLIAGVFQINLYGASLTSISIAVSSIVIYFFALAEQNNVLLKVAEKEMETAIEMKKKSGELLEQTVEALASAVDAKDTYTHGHSYRVAKYSRTIAQLSGISENDCDDIYIAGLLHDVGKIGINDGIINKKGKLTEEEFSVIKEHSILGAQILSKIVASPYLSVGARYHHERYDGNGYPDKLKGEDIPQIARIIAVADAYDAMTSKRSYRDAIPQMYVREELIKGMGTQFDPVFAKIMLGLIDKDSDYKMKENQREEEFSPGTVYEFNEFKDIVSVGIRITDHPITINLQYKPIKKGGQPTLILYDSADARYYLEDNSLSGEMDFVEFASIDINGEVYPEYVRDHLVNTIGTKPGRTNVDELYNVTINLTKQDDHLILKIVSADYNNEIIFALNDASRYVYFALTGENCNVDILDVSEANEAVPEGYIPRIADKISYINEPVGDIPNIQVDGWRTQISEIQELNNDIKLNLHALSLPSSRRIWHCPIIALFTSDDGTLEGTNYKELGYIRFDGEAWCDNPEMKNETIATKTDEFNNWSIWKQKNKAGVSCEVFITRESNRISIRIEDSGLITENITTIPKDITKVYYYFTGDQCAITNIKINSIS